MDKTENILAISLFVVIFFSWIAATFKSGFVSYSVWSLLKGDQPQFYVDKTKIKKFIALIATSLVVNGLYCLIFTKELAVIALFTVFNTVVISYALVYWVLLKEVPKTK